MKLFHFVQNSLRYEKYYYNNNVLLESSNLSNEDAYLCNILLGIVCDDLDDYDDVRDDIKVYDPSMIQKFNIIIRLFFAIKQRKVMNRTMNDSFVCVRKLYLFVFSSSSPPFFSVSLRHMDFFFFCFYYNTIKFVSKTPSVFPCSFIFFQEINNALCSVSPCQVSPWEASSQSTQTSIIKQTFENAIHESMRL